jgi:hypothetical protein
MQACEANRVGEHGMQSNKRNVKQGVLTEQKSIRTFEKNRREKQ